MEGEEFDFANPLNANIILKAVWKELIKVKVTYKFESTTEGKELPEEVMKLLPKSEEVVKGKDFTPTNPEKTEVVYTKILELGVAINEVESGKWFFKDYKPVDLNAAEDDIVIVGTWEYKAIPMNELFKPEIIELTTQDLKNSKNGYDTDYNKYKLDDGIIYKAPAVMYKITWEADCNELVKKLNSGNVKENEVLTSHITLDYKDGTSDRIEMRIRVSDEATEYKKPLNKQFQPQIVELAQKLNYRNRYNQKVADAIIFNSPQFLREYKGGYGNLNRDEYDRYLNATEAGEYPITYTIYYVDGTTQELVVKIKLVK